MPAAKTKKKDGLQLWAERFEAYSREEGHYENGRTRYVKVPAKCMVAEIEGPHKVACRETANYRDPENLPVCRHHKNCLVRPDWVGFVEGA